MCVKFLTALSPCRFWYPSGRQYTVPKPQASSCCPSLGTPFPSPVPTPSLWKLPIWPAFLNFCYFKNVMQIGSYVGDWLFFTQPIYCSGDSSKLLPVSIVCSFSLLRNIPWCACNQHLFTEGYLGGPQFFQKAEMTNRAAVNIHMKTVCVCDPTFKCSLGSFSIF